LAHRGLRVPLELPHRRPRRGGRGDRLALLPRLRRAERLRQPAGPAGRLHARRALRHQPSLGAKLRAGDEHPRDDLEDADGLDRRPGRPDDGADHMLVRTVECIEGRVEIEIVCEPAFDYGRTPAAWAMAADDLHTADATGAGQTFRIYSDLALGIEGNRVRGRHVLREGERAFCCMTWA